MLLEFSEKFPKKNNITHEVLCLNLQWFTSSSWMSLVQTTEKSACSVWWCLAGLVLASSIYQNNWPNMFLFLFWLPSCLLYFDVHHWPWFNLQLKFSSKLIATAKNFLEHPDFCKWQEHTQVNGIWGTAHDCKWYTHRKEESPIAFDSNRE